MTISSPVKPDYSTGLSKAPLPLPMSPGTSQGAASEPLRVPGTVGVAMPMIKQSFKGRKTRVLVND